MWNSNLWKILYAIDIVGLIGAVAIMRPSKSVDDLGVKSVKKKYSLLPLPPAAQGNNKQGS